MKLLLSYQKSTPAKATGTITISSFASLHLAVVTINGIALTEGTQWTAATSNGSTATSLAAAITTATATTLCTAAAVGAVITLTANTNGAAANSITMVSSDPTHAALSGTTLTGGNTDQLFLGGAVDVLVSAVNIVSGGSAGTVTLRNGTTAAGTAVLKFTGTASIGVLVEFAPGTIFPSGCFIDSDDNITTCTVFGAAQ